MRFLLFFMIVMAFGCSKKSSDNPSPTTPNKSNTNNNNNQTKSDTVSGMFYYTYKGVTYQIGMGEGYAQYGGYIYAPILKGDTNYFTDEQFNFYLPHYSDSSKFTTLIGKKIKQVNGLLPNQNISYNLYDTLNFEITLSNANVQYMSYVDTTKDTISPKMLHYFRFSSYRFKQHDYANTIFLASGDFSIAMSNSRNSLDVVTVTGYFKDMEIGPFNRK